MISFFQRISDRVKALLFTDAALDVEAELLSRSAERKADLLRQAHGYEQQGLGEVAQELRQQAGHLALERPLAAVLPAIGTPPEETPQVTVQEKETASPPNLPARKPTRR